MNQRTRSVHVSVIESGGISILESSGISVTDRFLIHSLLKYVRYTIGTIYSDKLVPLHNY